MRRKVETETIVRTAVLIFALINQGLTIAGCNPLPFTNEEFENGFSMALMALAAFWSWWKNNSFTQAALEADEKMHELKGN